MNYLIGVKWKCIHRCQFRKQIPSKFVGPNQRQMRFLAFGGVSVPRHIWCIQTTDGHREPPLRWSWDAQKNIGLRKPSHKR